MAVKVIPEISDQIHPGKFAWKVFKVLSIYFIWASFGQSSFSFCNYSTLILQPYSHKCRTRKLILKDSLFDKLEIFYIVIIYLNNNGVFINKSYLTYPSTVSGQRQSSFKNYGTNKFPIGMQIIRKSLIHQKINPSTKDPLNLPKSKNFS